MTPDQIALAFRTARLGATALAAYPAPTVPDALEPAYAIQTLAIGAWPDRVAGWKVAAVQPQWRERYPAERLSGPVFAKRVVMATAAPLDVPVIVDGYAAVEAEFALRIADNFPLNTRFTDTAALLPHVAAVHAAIEMAGSPLANLGALGPGAVISDFGNNTGLIVGQELTGFHDRSLADWPSAVWLNDTLVGEGSAERIPGGPLSALLFLVNNLVERGLTLRPGDWVSTGASAGIHPVKAGDHVRVSFDGQPAFDLAFVDAMPA